MIRKILYLEDNEEDFLLFRESMRRVRGLGEKEMFFVDHAPTTQAARSLMSLEHYDVIVIDINLGADSGIEFVHELWGSHHQRPMILTSGHRSVEFDYKTLELITRGRLQYLSKFELGTERFAQALRRALQCNWRLLVCDGGQQVSTLLAAQLTRDERRFEIDAADTVERALQMLNLERYDACVVDSSLPTEDIDQLLWNISKVPDHNKPAVIFAGGRLANADPLMLNSARTGDLGMLRVGEFSADALAGVIGRTCGESQWRTVRAQLHS